MPDDTAEPTEADAGRVSAGTLRRFAVLAATAAVTAAMAAVPLAWAATSMFDTLPAETLAPSDVTAAQLLPQNSYVLAADGSLLAELSFEEDRVPVTLAELPDHLVDAVVATEDAAFFEHAGVDHRAIVRAVTANVAEGRIVSGASTITQQYVKMTFLTPERSYRRKLQEAVFAVQLERQLSKGEILERYLNAAYFGEGVYGVGTAARRFFSVPVGELSLSQAATLAGLLRAPEANNPLNSPGNARARRDVVLGQMAAQGMITDTQAAAASAGPVVVYPSKPSSPVEPFFVDWVARLLVDETLAARLGGDVTALEVLGDDVDTRRRRVFQGGLRITTTLDPRMQEAAEAALVDQLVAADATAADVAASPMGALVAVEPGTGAVRALAVGPHTFGSCVEDGRWAGVTEEGMRLCDRTKVNPAVPGGGGSGRQPGSAFKPFVLAAALEAGVPAGLTLDARGPAEIDGCVNGDGSPYVVGNSGGNAVLDMYGALKASSNVYHVKVAALVGPEKVAAMAGRVGAPVPVRDVGCALALGATEVSPLEMASGYATFAARGLWCAPFPVVSIETAAGEVLFEHVPDCRQVVDVEVADRVVDMLAGPVSAGGTAPAADLDPWPTRGKTGTTNDFVDAWFVGFVRQVSTAAWVGFANGSRTFVDAAAATAACGGRAVGVVCPPVRETLTDVTVGGRRFARVFGSSVPAPLWTSFMRVAVEGLEPEGFVVPEELPTAPVPDLSQVPGWDAVGEFAEAAGFTARIEWVPTGDDGGYVIAQSPAPGAMAELGRQVVLLVASGSSRPPVLPDVTGVDVDTAVTVLEAAGVEVELAGVAVSDPAQAGLVFSMTPRSGMPLSVGVVRLDVGVLPGS